MIHYISNNKSICLQAFATAEELLKYLQTITKDYKILYGGYDYSAEIYKYWVKFANDTTNYIYVGHIECDGPIKDFTEMDGTHPIVYDKDGNKIESVYDEDWEVILNNVKTASANNLHGKILDENKLKQIIDKNFDKAIYAGIKEDWGHTYALIHGYGKEGNTDLWDYSIWATPVLWIEGKVIECWRYMTDEENEYYVKK